MIGRVKGAIGTFRYRIDIPGTPEYIYVYLWVGTWVPPIYQYRQRVATIISTRQSSFWTRQRQKG